jgi:hypothetical protein
MANLFADALAKFNVTAQQRINDAFVYATEEVQRSVVSGSELTGAPGQPVITGNLRNSWVGEFAADGKSWTLSTNVEYAPYIEDGANDIAFFNPDRGAPRSEVGGYHSVKLTESGFVPAIIPFVVGKAIAGKVDG